MDSMHCLLLGLAQAHFCDVVGEVAGASASAVVRLQGTGAGVRGLGARGHMWDRAQRIVDR